MRFRSESGQATVVAALTMPIFCGFLGLAVDVGSFYAVKRQVQAAADASAKAAIVELKRGKPGQMSTAASSAATENGIPNGVTMNYPPQAGLHAGDAKYVEVLISQQPPTMFMRFLAPATSMEVRARAVAGIVGIPPAGVFVLNRTRASSLEVHGGAELKSALDVWVSSNSGSAVSVSGGSCLHARHIGVTGGYSGSCFSKTPITGMIPDDDPLAAIPDPSAGGGCTETDFTIKHGSATLSPGVYCGGMNIDNGAEVNLLPGVYILRGGGLDLHNATLTGSGVMIYNTGDATRPAGNINIRSNASVSLSAPTAGPHAGVLFFFDRNLPEQTVQMEIRSSADTHLEGTLYALRQHIHVHSGSKSNTTEPWMIMVSDTLAVTNGSNLEIGADFKNSAVPSPIGTTVLVE